MKFISFQRGRLAVAMLFVAIGMGLIFFPRLIGWSGRERDARRPG